MLFGVMICLNALTKVFYCHQSQQINSFHQILLIFSGHHFLTAKQNLQLNKNLPVWNEKNLAKFIGVFVLTIMLPMKENETAFVLKINSL